MTALAMDVRELSDADIDEVNGGFLVIAAAVVIVAVVVVAVAYVGYRDGHKDGYESNRDKPAS